MRAQALAIALAAAVVATSRAEVCDRSKCAGTVRQALEIAAVDAETTFSVLQQMDLLEPAKPFAHRRRLADNTWADLGHATASTYVAIVMVAFCVACAALAAGLTMGLVSLEPLDLKIKSKSSDRQLKADAEAVLAVIDDSPRSPAEPSSGGNQDGYEEIRDDPEAAEGDLQTAALLGKTEGASAHQSRSCCKASRHHFILVTFLLFNSLANEALPLFLDELVPSYVAVIMSVTLVLIFGEIIPSAIFTGPNKLRVVASMTPLIYLVLTFLAPISYPIAWLLDKILGHRPLRKYTREEISALVMLEHRRDDPPEEEKKSSLEIVKEMTADALERQDSGMTLQKALPLADDITHDEQLVVAGVLKTAKMHVKDAMTSMEDVVSVSLDAQLDFNTVSSIVASGFSRIPVHCPKDDPEDRTDLRGFFLVKRLVTLKGTNTIPEEPSDDTDEDSPFIKVREFGLRLPVCVSPESSLLEALNVFQAGRSHMAFVSKTPNETRKKLLEEEPLEGESIVIGILTLEDIVEKILDEDIKDEEDLIRENVTALVKRGIERWKGWFATGKKFRLKAKSREGSNSRGNIRMNLDSLADAIEDMSKEQLDFLMQVFAIFDRDGDGKISQEELDQVLKAYDVKEVHRKKLFEALDDNGDGSVDFTEFANLMALEDPGEAKTDQASETSTESKPTGDAVKDMRAKVKDTKFVKGWSQSGRRLQGDDWEGEELHLTKRPPAGKANYGSMDAQARS